MWWRVHTQCNLLLCPPPQQRTAESNKFGSVGGGGGGGVGLGSGELFAAKADSRLAHARMHAEQL